VRPATGLQAVRPPVSGQIGMLPTPYLSNPRIDSTLGCCRKTRQNRISSLHPRKSANSDLEFSTGMFMFLSFTRRQYSPIHQIFYLHPASIHNGQSFLEESKRLGQIICSLLRNFVAASSLRKLVEDIVLRIGAHSFKKGNILFDAGLPT
jgi:hypothetical protein